MDINVEKYLKFALSQHGETIQAAHDKRVTHGIEPMTGFRNYFLDDKLIMVEQSLGGESKFVDSLFCEIIL